MIKRFNPITPSLRHSCLINKSIFWKKKKINQLSFFKIKHPGRNNTGSIILYTKGKRVKNKIKLINNNFFNFSIPGKVCRLEYDSRRSSWIALVYYKNGLFCYLNYINNFKIGNYFNSFYYSNKGDILNLKIGDNAYLKNIPITTIISNIESYYFSGATYSRSAGSYSIIIRKYNNIDKTLIKLRSGKLKLLSNHCKAIIGCNSNIENKQISIGKAGRNRLLGIKPNVRGVAMNPVDHPHGGGEGKKSKKVSPRSSWGKIFKWVKTGRYNKYNINEI